MIRGLKKVNYVNQEGLPGLPASRALHEGPVSHGVAV